MSEEVQSLLIPPAVLSPVLLVALVLAAARPLRRGDRDARSRLLEVFLLGVACQCAHTLEEFATGLHRSAPRLLGLPPMPAEHFVGFNLFWLGVWVISAVGVLRQWRIAHFPIWFFGLAMCLNGIVHPLLAVWVGGYFPGLVTSPLVGIMGAVVTKTLFQVTDHGAKGRVQAHREAIGRSSEREGCRE